MEQMKQKQTTDNEDLEFDALIENAPTKQIEEVSEDTKKKLKKKL